jgi:hypothetical protein
MPSSERLIWDAGRGTFGTTDGKNEAQTGIPGRPAGSLRASSVRFLKGPIPWPWISAAAALPGQALMVGLCLWRLAGATKTKTVFLGNADLAPLGIGRAAKSRALRALEARGLISVDHKQGRFPRITLFDSPNGA